MATLQQALTRIDAICPNAWDETAKLLWLNECESMIQMRILGAAPEACITYDADTDRSTTLIVPAPFDRLYVYYVIAMCDYAAHAGGNDKDILNAPVLTSPVMIRKEGETNSAGVYLSTIGTGEKRAEIRLEDVNENSPVAIANLRTPTGAGTDNYAATKGYVDSKVAAAGGNITVDATLSATSTNPVQNKAIKAALDGKAGTAVATASANGLMSAADKAKLDGIDDTVAAATPITIMLGSGGKATSSASYADICQALTSGRSVMLVGATGKAFWHLLSHTVGNNSVALMYAGISVSGDGLEVTGYTVTVTASGITYISRNWTSQ